MKSYSIIVIVLIWIVSTYLIFHNYYHFIDIGVKDKYHITNSNSTSHVIVNTDYSATNKNNHEQAETLVPFDRHSDDNDSSSMPHSTVKSDSRDRDAFYNKEQIRILHVINPFYTTSKKAKAMQRMTMRSIERAQQYFMNNLEHNPYNGIVDVMVVGYASDVFKREPPPPADKPKQQHNHGNEKILNSVNLDDRSVDDTITGSRNVNSIVLTAKNSSSNDINQSIDQSSKLTIGSTIATSNSSKPNNSDSAATAATSSINDQKGSSTNTVASNSNYSEQSTNYSFSSNSLSVQNSDSATIAHAANYNETVADHNDSDASRSGVVSRNSTGDINSVGNAGNNSLILLAAIESKPEQKLQSLNQRRLSDNNTDAGVIMIPHSFLLSPVNLHRSSADLMAASTSTTASIPHHQHVRPMVRPLLRDIVSVGAYMTNVSRNHAITKTLTLTEALQLEKSKQNSATNATMASDCCGIIHNNSSESNIPNHNGSCPCNTNSIHNNTNNSKAKDNTAATPKRVSTSLFPTLNYSEFPAEGPGSAGSPFPDLKPYTHIIYTNIDIGVVEDFYAAVHSLIYCFDTFLINRVEIPEARVANMSGFERHPASESYAQPLEPLDESSMELAYEYTQSFKQLHPGFDCLVIRKDRLPAFITYLGDVYIAFPPVGRMLTRAAKYADNECATITNMHSTFHLGTRNGDWDSDNDTLAYQTLNGNIIQERYEYLEAVNGGKLLGNGVRKSPSSRKNPRTAKVKKNQHNNKLHTKQQPEHHSEGSQPISNIKFSSSDHSDRKSTSKSIYHAIRKQIEKRKVRHRSHPKGHRQLTEGDYSSNDLIISDEVELGYPRDRRRLGSVKPKCNTKSYIPSSGIKGKFGRQCKYDSKYPAPTNSHMFFQDWRETHKVKAPVKAKEKIKKKKKKPKKVIKKAVDNTAEQIRSSKIAPAHSLSRHERRKKAKYQAERIKQQYTG